MQGSEIINVNGKITNMFFPKGTLLEQIEFAVFEIRVNIGRNIRCKGTIHANVGDFVSLTGKYSYGKFGQVFEFSQGERDLTSSQGKKAFIKKICLSKTNLLIDELGIDKALEALRNKEVEVLTSIKGIKLKTIEKWFDKLKEYGEVEPQILKLMSYNIPLETAKNICTHYKSDSVEVISKNPYILTGFKMSFSKVDDIAINMGVPFEDKRRIKSGVIATLKGEQDKQGHLFTKRENLILSSVETLSIKTRFTPKNELIEDSLNSLISSGIFIEENDEIFFEKTFGEKERIKKVLNRSKDSKLFVPFDISEEIKKYESFKTEENGFLYELGKEQKMAVENSIRNKISIITGGPGTGKTTVLDCILWILSKNGILGNVDLTAPTGKAAKRMSEATGYSASTIHRLLGVDPSEMTTEDEDMYFVHNRFNKLQSDCVVVDEVSMLDFSLASSLFEAIKKETRLLLVGDIYQLPPIKYGFTLRDLIDGGMPCVKLEEVKRQKGDSSIIPLALAIKNKTLELEDFKGRKDFGFIFSESSDILVARYIKGLQKVGTEVPTNDVVILTPQNTGDLGTIKLNNLIINELFPDIEKTTIGGVEFCVGSKVIQTKNDKETGVVNGETGYILEIEGDTFAIQFETGRVIYDKEKIKDLKGGYALTIHKSQGSEWKFVILVCSKSSQMNTNALVYTGVTRSRECLIIQGDKETFINSQHKLGRPRRSRIL